MAPLVVALGIAVMTGAEAQVDIVGGCGPWAN
jgi:hypothetical protein